MANKNYLRGRATEYKAKAELEKDGYVVIRASGSHGAFDLVAVNRMEVRFIQCKREKKSTNWDGLLEELSKIQTPIYSRKELWVWRDRKRFVKIIVESMQPEPFI
jgi:Holliday junction resolvase-like predicted endonuclease